MAVSFGKRGNYFPLFISGSKNTFLAYGIACIFVLIGFFGVNWWLKRQGIQMESHVPHETLAEDQQMTFDPHGVPSGLVRDLSSSKLKQADGEEYMYFTESMVLKSF
jgi:hypothetical protein